MKKFFFSIYQFLLKINSFHKKIFQKQINLVYIHGFSSRKDDHPDLDKQLEQYKIKWYSFDLKNHGGFKNDETIKDLSFEDLVKDAIKKIKKLKLKKFYLMGHSMGGSIAISIVARKVFAKRIKGLILECPHNVNTINLLKFTLKARRDMIKRSLQRNQKNESILKFLWNLKKEKQDYFPLLIKILDRKTLEIISERIEKIKIPTLLITGKDDYYVPSTLTKDLFEKHVKDLEVHEIAKAGHTVYLDEPEWFVEILSNFLKNKTNK